VKALRSSTSRAVADVLARAREQKRLSQRELAARIKRPHSLVGMIESHQRQVNVPEFSQLLKPWAKTPWSYFGRYCASEMLAKGFAQF
jgi:transcriptional regulator with XRE-family HTH domain